MKKIILLIASLCLSLSLFAQESPYSLFAEKFEQDEKYEVANVNRRLLKIALAFADRQTKDAMRNVEHYVGVMRKLPDEGRLAQEVATLVADHQEVMSAEKDGSRVAIYSSEAHRGTVFYVISPENEEIVMVLVGDIDYKIFLSEVKMPQ